MSVRTTRADSFTQTQKTQITFSDFLDNFDITPAGNQLARVTNENSVTQSIKNLIKTNIGERLFQPTVGSNVNHSLFELNDSITLDQIEVYIQSTINQFEPRANLISIVASQDPSNEYIINITINYSLINNPVPITFNLILQRVR